MATDPYSHALILNVDDNEGARYAKSRTLVHAGFSVLEAASGSEALSLAQSAQPNLILLDVKLPDINGVEVCRRIKENPTTQTILVLQTSASYIRTADKIHALDSGADSYLVEPIEPDELIANVKALLRLGAVERELREVDRRKNEFLATLAHELRNPLGTIRTSVELWRKIDPTVPQLQENTRNIISRQTDQLARLVDDLLDVSRISNGKIALRMEEVELKEFVGTALESSAHVVESRGHTLSVTLPDGDVWIWGDHVRLAQIVTNLLLNAAKFTHPGGFIDLVAEVVDDTLVLRVVDTGIGIAPESAETIFELFKQSAHIEERVSEGLGIGLSLVRALVDLHGGTVKAISAGIGQGSTFEIALPCHRECLAQVDTPANGLEAITAKRILIVDDNTDAAQTLCQLLSLIGHEVEVAYSGSQAIERARRFFPEIVFLDIGLPDLSGYQVARSLRALPQIPTFLLVALTGYGQEKDRQDALNAGFDMHFTKPLDFDKLNMLGLSLEYVT
jgi:signal transduction histidine kinase